MPVLWNPSQQTTTVGADSTYTCLLHTTEAIPVGILFRFQMWDSNTTYVTAISTASIASWDLVVSSPIPANKTLVLAMREANTALWEYNGSTTYASGGAGIDASYFGTKKTLIALAYAPKPSATAPTGVIWDPEGNGVPMFGIGFYDPTSTTPCTTGPPVGEALTAPNFPNQFSGYSAAWNFAFTVVFPSQVPHTLSSAPSSPVCVDVLAIQYSIPTYATASWRNLRSHITQPYTILQENFESVNRWSYWGTVVGEPETVVGSETPSPGPFYLSAAPGQLVPVYWRPRYQNVHTADTPITSNPLASQQDSGSAEIGLLVTAPLMPAQSIYFTIDEYNDVSRGFGPRDGTDTVFLHPNPSFIWTIGSVEVPAGTVVFISNIGASSGPITIQNAHYSAADVGSITTTMTSIVNKSVTSLIALGAWFQEDSGVTPITPLADKVVCAALSDQYAGDFPPLSPGLTINCQPVWIGAVIYMQDQVIDACGMHGAFQAAAVNTTVFTKLPYGTVVLPQSMPFYQGMTQGC
jgi:hypothetical protein